MSFQEEYFLTEDSNAPLCQQFDAFYERIPFALKSPESDVIRSIQTLEEIEDYDFVPDEDEFKVEMETALSHLEDTKKEQVLKDKYHQAFDVAYKIINIQIPDGGTF